MPRSHSCIAFASACSSVLVSPDSRLTLGFFRFTIAISSNLELLFAANPARPACFRYNQELLYGPAAGGVDGLVNLPNYWPFHLGFTQEKWQPRTHTLRYFSSLRFIALRNFRAGLRPSTSSSRSISMHTSTVFRLFHIGFLLLSHFAITLPRTESFLTVIFYCLTLLASRRL